MFMRTVERESLQTVRLNVPLCLAAERLNKRLIQLFVQHGVKVNTCNDDGNTPLHFAVSSRHDRMSDSREQQEN
jgi:ankyrin repeat protein